MYNISFHKGSTSVKMSEKLKTQKLSTTKFRIKKASASKTLLSSVQRNRSFKASCKDNWPVRLHLCQ